MPWFSRTLFDTDLDAFGDNVERSRAAVQHLNGLIDALVGLRVDYIDDFCVAVLRTVNVLMRLLRDCSDAPAAGRKSR